MASRRLIKGIRSLAPKAFKTTKLSPVILPRGVMIVVTDFIAEVGIKCRMVKKSPVKAVTSFELTVKKDLMKSKGSTSRQKSAAIIHIGIRI